ncbi:outer membrane factor lipoprotein domain-containing protein [Komagataeibacter kakiaceti]|uniref:TolC family protein n=1 Tax=Komagataeibacter kakiaceti TaxID=943261 RepID=UPI000470F3DE|nr:TolC family protein [Komagataeibacter kakiaceti]
MTAGCAVGPNFHKPTPWTPKQYGGPDRIQAATGASGSPAQVASQTTPDDPDTAWWNVFHDAELTKLEQRVATDNLDVRRYAYRMAQSRAELRIAGAERYPAMSATGSYARQQYSTKMLQRIVTDVESDPQLSNNPVFSQYAPPARRGQDPAVQPVA